MPSPQPRRRLVAFVRTILGTSAIRAQRSMIAGVVVAVVVGFGVAAAVPVFTVLHQFAPRVAVNGLIQATDGNFYGTTTGGGGTGCGGNGCGTVFKMTPAGIVTILYAFSGGTDGAFPSAALIQATDGNFYGTTAYGGSASSMFCQTFSPHGCGTVFKMTSAGTVTTLHTFIGGATDGAHPISALIQATDGNFYGMTPSGGNVAAACNNRLFPPGCGTVFKMTSDGSLTILHAFIGGPTDGANGLGAANVFLQATDGNFYGTTPFGGFVAGECASNPLTPGGCGTVFRMTPDGTVAILHAFTGINTDGRIPNNLIQASDGNFYGTPLAFNGIGCFSSQTCGAIFKITSTSTFTILPFAGHPAGASPNSLIQGTDGSFYGTILQASGDTTCNATTTFRGCGTVFKMTLDGTVTALHAFTECSPNALVRGTDNNLYGTTVFCELHAGGAGGTVFRLRGLNPSSDDLVVDFGASGEWILFDGNASEWEQLHAAAARNIVTGDLDGNGIDEVILDFGSAYGIWVWVNDTSWYQLHPSAANRMATGDLDGHGKSEALIDFPGAGIWVWGDNTSWSQLHSSSASNMLTADLDGNGMKEAIVEFSGFGIWVRQNNTSWVQLHPLNSRLMTAGDFDGNGQADLVVDFAGYGLWKYSNNSTWSQVHALNASHLAAGDVDGGGKSDLVVDFGSPYGIWKLLNGTTWSQLHTLTSTNILTADLDGNGKADVVVNFGAAGLWDYANNTSWVPLHTVSPGVIAVGHINAPAP